MSKKVIIVEDEKAIADILQFNLEREGFDVLQFNDGKLGLDAILVDIPDIVLLDVMLPSLDGFEILENVRRVSQVPIIMLTAREEEQDKIQGLENGADDYVTKPFSMKELIARVKANTRREIQKTSTSMQVIDQDLSIDHNKGTIIYKDKNIELTTREYEITKYLLDKPNQVVSREELMKEVWKYEFFSDLRSVDVAIRRLREKIEENSAKPKYIITKRGQGYYFTV
ncbi:MAG: winged helix-turn-helix domain-containing protein [Clostridia bacterium]